MFACTATPLKSNVKIINGFTWNVKYNNYIKNGDWVFNKIQNVICAILLLFQY